MSHSKGLLRGTCPGTIRKSGRPHEVEGTMIQQWKCGRCGWVRNKKVKRCWIFHDFRNTGEADHGGQKQKCARCGERRRAAVSGCGLLRSCQFHKCDKTEGLHCRRCGRGRG